MDSEKTPPAPTTTPAEPETPTPSENVIQPTVVEPTAEPAAEAVPAEPGPEVFAEPEPAPEPQSSEQPESAAVQASTEPASPAEGVPGQPEQATTDSGTSTTPSADAAGPTLPTPAAAPSGNEGGRARKKWLLPVLIIVLVVLLAGGYVFGFYLPNRPGAIYSSSLKNSGKAIDKLIDYSKSESAKNYKSYSFDGTMKVKATSGSFDATLAGTFDSSANGTLNIKADAMGQKFAADVRSLHTAGNTTPDVYVRLSGIKSTLDSYGLNSLDNLDGQWISIDHTILDTLGANLNQAVKAGETSSAPTSEQLNDAVAKVQAVNKQYLFTADSSKAVLKQSKFIGKETKDGRAANHYKVGYDKAHLEAYVKAVGAALDSSKLNDWSKKAQHGQSLTKAMDWDELTSEVKNSKGNYSFDLWTDNKTKLVHSLQFSDPADSSSIFTLTQNYTGGDKYPFAFAFTGKDEESGGDVKGNLQLTVDTKSHAYTGVFGVTEAGTEVSANFTLKPSDEAVKVTAPSSSKSLVDVLGQLGLGGAATGLSTTSVGSAGSDLFTLTQ